MQIYFIQCGKNGPIKIGQTNDIKERIKQLQTGCPYELKLLWVYTGDDYTEDGIHEMFSHERIRGEWFHPSRKLIKFIKNNLLNETIIKAPNGRQLEFYESLSGHSYCFYSAGTKAINYSGDGYELWINENSIGVSCDPNIKIEIDGPVGRVIYE